MKYLITIISLLLALPGGKITAQESLQDAFSISWGMSYTKRQDLTISPMIHRGWSPLNVIAEYRRSAKWEQQVTLKFSQFKDEIGEPFEYTSFYSDETLQTYPHNLTTVDINYAIGRKILTKGSYDIAIGARAKNRLMPGSYYLGDFNSLAYYFTFGLDIWAQMGWKIDETHQINAQLGLPMFSWNARVDHLWHTDEYLMQASSHKSLKTLGEFIKDGNFESWGKAQGLDFDLQYFYTLSNRWQMGLRYRTTLNFHQDPNPFAQAEQGFFITGQIKF